MKFVTGVELLLKTCLEWEEVALVSEYLVSSRAAAQDACLEWEEVSSMPHQTSPQRVP